MNKPAKAVTAANYSGVEALVDLTAPLMVAVNETILSRTGSDVTMIPEVANHLISSGGKRLRPMLTLASAGLCGYQGAGHVMLAASVEFMHTATLLHDDVVDGSEMRRGKRAARMLWGNEASVLVGDFLLGQAFRMMVEVGSLPCLDVLSKAAAVIAEGEVLQLSSARNVEAGEAHYLKVIEAKTAALFAAACEVGPLLAHASEAQRQACYDYGLNLGIAFQLVDDALDYGGASIALGKNTGDDFREGKITLPVLLSYAAGNADEKRFWREALAQNAHALGKNDGAALAMAQSYLAAHGAMGETIARAEAYGNKAIAALQIFPASPMKAALEAVVRFCIERAH